MNATPRPWKIGKTSKHHAEIYDTQGSAHIASVYYGHEYNTPFILSAVNSYDAMREALQHIVLDIEHDKQFPSDHAVIETVYERAKSALALAKGE